MAFSVEVGSDLYGQKHNMMLSFPQQPSLWEFRQSIEAQFDVKARSCRPAGYPDVPFKVETLQVFGDQGMWVDLLRDDQLRAGCQAWVFQPESIWHSDAQGVIPQPDQAAQWAPRQGSPPRQRGVADAGCPPTLVEKMTAVFHEIDGQGKGYLLRDDIERAFARADMQFNSYSDAFSQADINRSGHVTWDEWQQFAISNASVVDALFFRMKDTGATPQYTAPPPIQYVSRQAEYPGQQAPYSAAPQQQYNSPEQYPPQYSRPEYTSQPAAAYGQPQPQPQYSQPPPQQQYSQPPPQQQYSQPPPQQQYSQPPQQQQYSQPPPQQQYSQPPPQQQYAQPQQQYGAPQQQYAGGDSPRRQQARSEYEAARQRAESARLQKEQAERDERAAWEAMHGTR